MSLTKRDNLQTNTGKFVWMKKSIIHQFHISIKCNSIHSLYMTNTIFGSLLIKELNFLEKTPFIF